MARVQGMTPEGIRKAIAEAISFIEDLNVEDLNKLLAAFEDANGIFDLRLVEVQEEVKKAGDKALEAEEQARLIVEELARHQELQAAESARILSEVAIAIQAANLASDRIPDLLKRMASAEENLAFANSEFSTLLIKQDEFLDTVAEQTAEVSRLNSEFVAVNQTVGEAVDKVDQSTIKVNQIGGDLELARTTLDAKIKKSQEDISAAKIVVDKHQNEIETLTGDLGSLTTQHTTLATNFSAEVEKLETADASLLTNMNTKVGDLTATTAAQSTAISAAKAQADKGVTDAAAAKSAADQAALAAINKSNAAREAAEDYAKEQAEAAQARAEETAAAEALRVAQIEATAAKNSAATDAQTKADEAERLAKLYAEAQAKTAKEQAEETAAQDAATKAENARIAAEANAKVLSDKAQQAAVAAQSSIDNLEVGGRNFLKDSSNTRLSGSDYRANVAIFLLADRTRLEVKPSGTRPWNAWSAVGVNHLWDPGVFDDLGTEYTLSADIRANLQDSANARLRFDIRQNMSVARASETLFVDTAGKWVRVSVTLQIPQREGLNTFLIQLASGDTVTPADWVEIRGIKIERGNRATDWTPAPEDVDASVAKAQAEAETARAEATSKANAARDAAEKTAKELADQAQADAEVEAARAALEIAQREAKAAQDAAADDATLKANDARTAAENLARAEAEAARETAEANAAIEAQKKADKAKQDAEATADTLATAAKNAAATALSTYQGLNDPKVTKAQKDASSGITKADAAKSQADKGVSDAATALAKANEANNKLPAITSDVAAAAKAALEAVNALPGIRTEVIAAKTQADKGVTDAADAKSAVDNLQIGGRNLRRNSNSFSDYGTYNGSVRNEIQEGVSVPEWGATDATRLKYTKGAADLVTTPGVSYLPGETVTFSYWFKNVGTTPIGVAYNGLIPHTVNTYEPGFSGRVVLTGKLRYDYDWFQHQFRFVTNTKEPGSNTMEFILWRSKLEAGTKATDWTPAPEDVDAGITTAQSTAETARTEAETKANQAKRDAEATAQQLANDAKSAAEGTAATLSNKALQDATTALTNYQKVNDPKVSTAQNTANTAKSAADTAKQRADKGVTDAATAKQVAEKVGTDLENLEIGGRNLLKNSTSWWFIGSDHSATTDRSQAGTFKVLQDSAYWNAYEWLTERWIKRDNFFDGKSTYTASVEMRVTSPTGGEARISLDLRTGGSLKAIQRGPMVGDTGGKWVKTYITLTMPNEGEDRSLFLVGANNTKAGDTVEVRNPKIERGNKATDWTPAPEDTQAEIDALVTKADTLTTGLSNAATQEQYNQLNIELWGDQGSINKLQGEINANNQEFQDWQREVNDRRDIWEQASTDATAALTRFAITQSEWNTLSATAIDANTKAIASHTALFEGQNKWNEVATSAIQAQATLLEKQDRWSDGVNKALAWQDQLNDTQSDINRTTKSVLANQAKWNSAQALVNDSQSEINQATQLVLLNQSKWNTAQEKVNNDQSDLNKAVKAVQDKQEDWNDGVTKALASHTELFTSTSTTFKSVKAVQDNQQKWNKVVSDLVTTNSNVSTANKTAIEGLNRILGLKQNISNAVPEVPGGVRTSGTDVAPVFTPMAAWLENGSRATFTDIPGVASIIGGSENTVVTRYAEDNYKTVVDPNTEYKFSMWVKAAVSGKVLRINAGAQTGSDVFASRTYTAGETNLTTAMTSQYLLWHKSVPTTWTKIEGTFKLKPHVREFYISHIQYNYGAGTAPTTIQIADIQIYPNIPSQADVNKALTDSDAAQNTLLAKQELWNEASSRSIATVENLWGKTSEEVGFLNTLTDELGEQISQQAKDFAKNISQLFTFIPRIAYAQDGQDVPASETDGFIKITRTKSGSQTTKVAVEAVGNWVGSLIIEGDHGKSDGQDRTFMNYTPIRIKRDVISGTRIFNLWRSTSVDHIGAVKVTFFVAPGEVQAVYPSGTNSYPDPGLWRVLTSDPAPETSDYNISLNVTWAATTYGDKYGIRIRSGTTVVAEILKDKVGPLLPGESGVRTMNLNKTVKVYAGRTISLEAYSNASQSPQRRISKWNGQISYITSGRG